jgi:hypothetical protein
MTGRNSRIPWSTLLVLFAIVALGCIFLLLQRKEERLRAALALYKNRSHGRVAMRLRDSAWNVNWPDQTPLGEVLEKIKLGTQGGFSRFPLGVPIVIDPIGLAVAGRSLDSPVQQPSADQDISLGKKLQIVLKPLGLACEVKNATIVITSEGMVDERYEDPVDDEE